MPPTNCTCGHVVRHLPARWHQLHIVWRLSIHEILEYFQTFHIFAMRASVSWWNNTVAAYIRTRLPPWSSLYQYQTWGWKLNGGIKTLLLILSSLLKVQSKTSFNVLFKWNYWPNSRFIGHVAALLWEFDVSVLLTQALMKFTPYAALPYALRCISVWRRQHSCPLYRTHRPPGHFTLRRSCWVFSPLLTAALNWKCSRE